MPAPIFVIGSSNTDMVVKTARLPGPGETVLGGTFFMNPGGKGGNQAVAAARLGGKVTLVAHVGDDIFGQQARAHFQKEKIETSFISTDSVHPSGIALIVVDDQGENNITVASGSNGYLNPEQVASALSHVIAPAIVLLQMEIPETTVEYAVAEARRRNLTIILNPAPARAITPSTLALIDVITPNEHEAELLTGIRVTGPESAAKAARYLRDQGVSKVVITLGSKGAFMQDGEVSSLVPAPRVAAIDTTAAGDCFNGALAVALAEGQPLIHAVQLACAAASISVTRLGAQASMPDRKELKSTDIR